jgi:Icc-related predicted phosphoesterase
VKPQLPLAIVGDVHANTARLRLVLDAIAGLSDVRGFLVTGDLAAGPMRRLMGAAGPRDVLALLRACGMPFVFVPGNHDTPRMDEPENVDGQIRDFCGWRVLGIGGSPRAFGFPYEWDDGSVDVPAGACDLVLAHAPPAGTALARTARGVDAGSAQVRDLLRRGPSALVCGHIHEGVGIEEVDEVPCYNAGALGGPFDRAQYGLLTFEGKVAFRHVTLD